MTKNAPSMLGRSVSCALAATLAVGCIPATALAQAIDLDAAGPAAQLGDSDAGNDVSFADYDRANLPAGSYEMSLSLNQATAPDTASMAGASVASDAVLEVADDGTYSVVVTLQTMNVMGIWGDITQMYRYPSAYVSDGVAYFQGEREVCPIESTYVAEHDGATYPRTVRVPVSERAIANGYIPVAITTTGMSGADGGPATVDAVLKLDWTTFDKVYGKVGVIDKAALEAQLSQAHAIPASSSVDYVLLSRAISAAEEVDADSEATQAQVDAQAGELANALKVYNGEPLSALSAGCSYNMPISFIRADGSASMAGNSLSSTAKVTVAADGSGYDVAVTTTADNDALISGISYGEGDVAAEPRDNGDGTRTFTLRTDVITHALKVSFSVKMGTTKPVGMTAYALIDTSVAQRVEPDAPLPDPEPAATAERLFGNDASQTSAAISAEAFSGEQSDWVVIARDDDFADAMSATGLAGTLGAPILLANRESGLSDEVKAEVGRLGAKKAYVIGGKGAIPADLEGQLAELGIDMGDDLRVFGTEAADTSVACANKIVEHGGSCDKAIVAYGGNFQDALSMSSFAYKYGVPIFLQAGGDLSADRSLTADGKALLTTGAFSGAKVFVAGGNGAVSTDSVEGVVGSDLRGGARIFGEDGYDTSNQVARWMTTHGDVAGEAYLSADVVTVACGALAANGTDALAGAALAGRAGGVLLLACGAEFAPQDATTIAGTDSNGDQAFLEANASSVRKAYTLGGNTVMPTAFIDRINDVLAGK